jgi:hypothetical protein
MARKRKETKNPTAILKTYTAGASLAELRDKYGITGKGQLARVVLDALIQSGKMPALTRGRPKRDLPSEFPVAVNKRGTIVLPKDAVAGGFRFVPGHRFVARRRGKKIILTLAG